MRKSQLSRSSKRIYLNTAQWLSTLIALVALFAIASAMLGIPFAHASVPSSQASPPQVAYMQQRLGLPTFTNKTLHWTQTVSNYTAGSHDPENGQVLTGDIWVLTGSDNLPVSIHMRYTRSDGTLVQEIVQTRDSETDFFGAAYGPHTCLATPHTMSQQQLQSALPPFIAKTLLSGNSYKQIQTSSSRAFPRTVLLGSMQPEQVYASSNVAQSWQAKITYASNMSDTKTLDLDGQNRIMKK